MECKLWKTSKTDRKRSLRIGIVLAVICLTVAFAIAYIVLQAVHGNGHTCSECLGVGTVLGVILGIIFVVGLFIGTMWLYYHDRQKNAYSKYFVEVKFIAIVLLICVGVKLITSLCLYLSSGGENTKPIEEGISTVLASFYESIGVLTFNGINAINEIWARIIYFGMSMYAGLMFLGIISAKASYEGFSYIQMRFFSECNADVYVFTALTDETLQLAKSIKQNNDEQNKDIKCIFKRHKVRIVFAGSALEPFDRHNALCREVMANGFLYWSYAGGKKSISKVLHLNNQNVGDYKKRFAVFAFEAKNHIPEEENNLDAVFEDIKKRIDEANDSLRIEYFILTKREINYQAYNDKMEELKGVYKKSVVVEKNLDEEFYSRFVVEVWNEANAVGKQSAERIMDAGLRGILLKNAFDKSVEFKNELSVWSLGFGGTAEAITRELFIQSPWINEEGYSRRYDVDVFDKYASAEGAFKFSHPSYVFIKDSGVSHFTSTVNAYCERAKKSSAFELLGLEKEELSKRTETLTGTVNSASKEVSKYDRLQAFDKCVMHELCLAIGDKAGFDAFIKNAVENMLCDKPLFDDKKLAATVENEVKKKFPTVMQDEDFGAELYRWLYRILECGLPHPVYRFNTVDCMGVDFFKNADRLTDENALNAQMLCPDVLVVATGDDYQNTRLVNALAQDIVNKKQNADSRQFIVVNVFDSHNNDLISSFGGQWNGAHTQLDIEDKGLTVIVVGNYENTYCIDGMREEIRSAAHKNYTYDFASSNVNKDLWKGINDEIRKYSLDRKVDFEVLLDALRMFVSKLQEIADGDAKEGVQKDKNTYDFSDCMLKYDMLNMWKKQPNRSVVSAAKLYKAIYEEYLKANEDMSDEMKKVGYALITSKVEHDRWVRQHIADGWILSREANGGSKHHDCLTDFKQVDKSTLIYDFMNAAWAAFEEQ